MRRKSFSFLLLVFSAAFPALLHASEPDPSPEGVEMIVWEHQNWETNGGFERLTLWRDGRSEVVVAPLSYAHDSQENLRPRKGWVKVRRKSPPHSEFVREDIYPPEVVRTKIREALAAGIHLLKSFKPGYVDGEGTRVVIRMSGREKETVIPMFMDRDRGTLNYKRFLAVSKILGGFDKSAYDVVTGPK